MKVSIKKRIIIIGAGGHGKEVYSYIRNSAEYKKDLYIAGFVDEKRQKEKWLGTKIIGNFFDLKDFLAQNKKFLFYYITAVGGNKLRQRFVKKIENLNVKNLKAWSIYHQNSTVGHEVEIGEGSCLAPGSIVTTHVKIGRHCILNVNSSISHDCVVGDFVNINPGAIICGNVKIGNGCFIGAKAVVIDKVSIGDWAIIGAGAVVTEDIPENVTAVGVPAKVIKKNYS